MSGTSRSASSRPRGVSEYSTCGGTTGRASRSTSPSLCRVRSVWASIFSLTPSARRRSSLQRSASPPAGDIVATARELDAIADLAERGVAVRRADYTDPSSLKEAFAGVDRAVLVSSSAVGERVEQHRNVITAADEAGVELLAYTSIL